MELTGRYANVVAFITNKINTKELPVPSPGSEVDHALGVLANPLISDGNKTQAIKILNGFLNGDRSKI